MKAVRDFHLMVSILLSIYNVCALDIRQYAENMVVEANTKQHNSVWNLGKAKSFFQALHSHEKLRGHGPKQV